jgi:hypothetical protein
MSNVIQRTLAQLTRFFNRAATSDSVQEASGFARERTAEEIAERLRSVNETGLDHYYAARWKCHRLWG